MSELFRPARSLAADGHDIVITPETLPWEYSGLRVVTIDAGDSYRLETEEDEMIVLPLRGRCTANIDGELFELNGRSGVFDAVSDFAYVPRDAVLVITAPDGGEYALCTARSRRRLDPYRIDAADVEVEVRGGGIGSRQINNYLAAGVREADRLICVEVLTPAGNWSSFPPHKHDEFSEEEVPLEEIYYFRFDRHNAMGLFSVYTSDGSIDVTDRVGDGDVVFVPRGYHGPSAPAPGYAMYFLNVMAGPSENRVWKFTDDPQHAWAREMLSDFAPDPRLPMTSAT